MVFGRWSDSRHFLHFSVSLDLPQYKTVQFVPLPPEVGKPGSSDLMLHEAIYQGLKAYCSLHTIGGLPQPRLCPCKVRTFQSLRLFKHPSPHASSGIHFNHGSKTPGTSPFGVLPPVCATLQELRHVPHWLVY